MTTQHLIESAQIPPRHWAMKEPKRDGEWGKTLGLMEEKMKSNQGAMLSLIGLNGNGKTQLAVEIMRQVLAKENSALYTTAINFFLRLKETFKRGSEGSEMEVLDEHAAPRLLVIDEFNRRAGGEWESNLIFELINRRYNAMKSTILIDNGSLNDFEKAVGPSLFSRMNETGGVIVCNWPSFR